MARFSSVPIYKSMMKSKVWKLGAVKQMIKKQYSGKYMERKTGFRDKGTTSFSFEYIGDQKE
jgi:hypothetical protein